MLLAEINGGITGFFCQAIGDPSLVLLRARADFWKLIDLGADVNHLSESVVVG